MPPKFTIEEPWTKAGFSSQPRAQQNLAIHGVLAHMVRTVRDGLGQSQVQLEDMRRRLERLETLVEVSEAGLGADTEPRHPPSGVVVRERQHRAAPRPPARSGRICAWPVPSPGLGPRVANA